MLRSNFLLQCQNPNLLAYSQKRGDVIRDNIFRFRRGESELVTTLELSPPPPYFVVLDLIGLS